MISKKLNLLILSLIIQTSVAPTIEEIKVKVGGFVDEHCAEGLARKFSTVPGVKQINVTRNGHAHIKLEENNKFNLNQLKPIIESKTSYKIKSIKIIATGKIERVYKYYTLNINNSPHKIFLTDVPKIDSTKKRPKEGKGLIQATGKFYDKTINFFAGFFGNTEKLSQQVRMHCKHNAKIRFIGKIHGKADGSLWLSRNSAKIAEIYDDSDLIPAKFKMS